MRRSTDNGVRKKMKIGKETKMYTGIKEGSEKQIEEITIEKNVRFKKETRKVGYLSALD